MMKGRSSGIHITFNDQGFFFIAAEAIARTMAGTGAKDVQKIQHANKEIKNKLSFCCGLVVDLNIHS